MVKSSQALIAPLFVPASRPDRFAKAADSGADAVIIDLEDAVAADQKDAARAGLARFGLERLPVPVYVRVNPSNTSWFAMDLDVIANLPITGIMLPKVERSTDLEQVSERLGSLLPVVALVETAVGIGAAMEIAEGPNVVQLAFGSIDFALDIGARHERESLLFARSVLVVVSRVANLPAPLDGVTAAISDLDVLESDALHASGLGFGGKLAIHPNQILPIRKAFAPTDKEIAWAQRVVSAQRQAAGQAAQLDGMMIDAPVCERARRILARIEDYDGCGRAGS